VVSGVDVAANQVEAARLLALEGRLDVDFSVAPAEETGLEDSTFDVVTANQCWLYFDLKRAISEVRRILKPGGLLVVSYFSHLPRADAVAKASEQLILRYNPHWSGADWDGRVPARPGWSRDAFELRAMFYYDEPVTFSKESWRGRVRALRGIGATLSDEKVRAFDKEHAALLDLLVDGAFTVLHRVNAHVFEFSDTSRSAV